MTVLYDVTSQTTPTTKSDKSDRAKHAKIHNNSFENGRGLAFSLVETSRGGLTVGLDLYLSLKLSSFVKSDALSDWFSLTTSSQIVLKDFSVNDDNDDAVDVNSGKRPESVLLLLLGVFAENRFADFVSMSLAVMSLVVDTGLLEPCLELCPVAIVVFTDVGLFLPGAVFMFDSIIGGTERCRGEPEEIVETHLDNN